MAEDWAADVKKYVADADDAIIAGIVRYCGIALRNRDSSLVAMSDKKETDRVRENFLKKKLGQTEADSVLDAAIAAVGERMKADRTKNRVTVYYLLADNFGKLGLFAKAAKAAAPAKATTKAKAPAKPKVSTKKAPTKAASAGAGAAALGLASLGDGAKAEAAPANDTGSGSAVAGAAAALGAAGAAVSGAASSAASGAADLAGKAADAVGDAASSAADTAGKAGAAVAGAAGAAAAGAASLAGKAGDSVGGAVSGLSSSVGGSDDEGGSNWNWALYLALALLGLFLIWWLFFRPTPLPADAEAISIPAATEAAAAFASAPAEGSAEVKIPDGAGVTSEMRDGKPVVKVYFDTGKTDVVPAFVGAADGLKAWLASNEGSSLAISGFADPSGNAAANAELSKKRAQAVQAALVAAGVPESSAELVKPAESTDAKVDAASARRVEVVVR